MLGEEMDILNMTCFWKPHFPIKNKEQRPLIDIDNIYLSEHPKGSFQNKFRFTVGMLLYVAACGRPNCECTLGSTSTFNNPHSAFIWCPKKASMIINEELIQTPQQTMSFSSLFYSPLKCSNFFDETILLNCKRSSAQGEIKFAFI